MSSYIIKSDLFAELSAEEQQNLSGGRFWGGKPRPDITVDGTLTDSSGNSFPVRILGFIAGQRSRRPQPYSFNRY
ncbi:MULTISPECIES: hypothetical protein [unclassified Anabaena]|uniref:hypothetical protein n=1 Tax=unclassified Anabaena TaxID=2619674 RepID=UPI0039C761A4